MPAGMSVVFGPKLQFALPVCVPAGMSVEFGLVLQFVLPVCFRTVDEKEGGTEDNLRLSQAL